MEKWMLNKKKYWNEWLKARKKEMLKKRRMKKRMKKLEKILKERKRKDYRNE